MLQRKGGGTRRKSDVCNEEASVFCVQLGRGNSTEITEVISQLCFGRTLGPSARCGLAMGEKRLGSAIVLIIES